MWAKSDGEIDAPLPRRFNAETMYGFINRIVDEQRNAKCATVTFDFTELGFIEPVGVVSLSNLVEYFRRLGVEVKFKFTRVASDGTRYLDGAGFFERYLGAKQTQNWTMRSTTMPLQLIVSERATEYLYFRLMPWIAFQVNQSNQVLAPLRASIEEIFHNVRDHSGVDIGCCFAQVFPNDRRMQIAISDFGDGIPSVVRRVQPSANDSDALRLASQEGFTTKTNVWNRGAGLPTLIRFVTERNGGTVLIASGRSVLFARLDGSQAKVAARTIHGWYPGTLVQVTLRLDRLPELYADIEAEEFSWE